jgi:hypothetical protein
VADDGVLVHGDEREVRRGAVAEPINEVGLLRLPKRSFIHAAGASLGFSGRISIDWEVQLTPELSRAAKRRRLE